MNITDKMIRDMIKEELRTTNENELLDDEEDNIEGDDSESKNQLKDALISLGKDVPRYNLTTDEVKEVASIIKMTIELAKAGNNHDKLKRGKEQLEKIFGGGGF
jgi:hypothetical protein